MKSKKEYIILAAVIAALAAYLVFHETDQTHYELPVLSDLPAADTAYIKVTNGQDTVELKKKDDRWQIFPEGYPADDGKAKAMADAIQTLTLTAMVSETESYPRYELDSENRIRVAAGPSADKIVRTFDIGKTAPSNRHTFVKLADDPRVYHARDSFRNKFDQTKDALRDKTVLKVDRNQVQQVTITDKDGNAVLQMAQVPAPAEDAAPDGGKNGEKEGDAAAPAETLVPEMIWQDADGNPVTEANINNFFNNVSNLKAQSYIDGKTKADFTDPLYTITMTGAQTWTLSVYEKLADDDDTYPAVSSENDYPFMLPDYKMDNMVKKD